MDGLPMLYATKPRAGRLAAGLIALATLVVIVLLALSACTPATGQLTGSTLETIKRTQVLRVGFEGYPPYTIQDPRTRAVSGYSADLINAIADEAGWRVEWVRTSPDTKVADLKTGKFDLMVEPIFQTIPRALEADFTRPYADFGYATGVVRKGDDRFPNYDALNQPGVRVVVRQGYTDEGFARKTLPEASIRALRVNDINQVFLEVTLGNADIALADTAQAQAFAAAHRNAVEVVFAAPAPASVPAGFMLRQGDPTFARFLDTSLGVLRAEGFFDRLDERYGVQSRSRE